MYSTQEKEKEKTLTLPLIAPKGIRKIRNPRIRKDIRFSPIIERYIVKYKYKTRNTIQSFKMKFTEYDKN